MRPAERAAIFSSSLSTQMTSLPRSAKTAPVTSPTYPVPATQMFIRTGSENYSIADRRGQGESWQRRSRRGRVRPPALASPDRRGPRAAAGPRPTRRRRPARLASRPLFVRLGGGPAEEDPREGGERRHRGRHPHDHAAEPLVLQRGELKDAGRRRVERRERRGGQRDEWRDHSHGHAHQEQVEQLGAVRRAREHRVRREDWPPREHGRRDEGQVLDHVEGVMLEGGVVESGQMPDDEGAVVEPEGNREPREPAEQREQPQAREQGGEQRGRDGGEQERRRRQGQQEVLHHVGAQEGAVAQVVERPVERSREHDERAREGQEAAGGEPPALRARGPQVESGEAREAREDLGVPFAHYARATPAPISAITARKTASAISTGPTKMKE